MIQKSPQHLRVQNVCSWKSHHHHPYYQGLVPFWCFLSSKEIDLCLSHPTFCWPVGFIFKIYLCQFCLLCSVLVWRWYVFNYPQILVLCLWSVNCSWLGSRTLISAAVIFHLSVLYCDHFSHPEHWKLEQSLYYVFFLDLLIYVFLGCLYTFSEIHFSRH